MASSDFSIFPDGELTSGHGLKGNVPRSKKKALCDVKNTLQSRRTGLSQPLRKLNLEHGEGPCIKQPIKETPAKVTSRQESTFTISRDKENDVYWDKCNSCNAFSNELFDERPESTRLKNPDIDYLRMGLLSHREPVYNLEDEFDCSNMMKTDNWFDMEMNIPPFSPPVLVCEDVALIPLSDDEA